MSASYLPPLYPCQGDPTMPACKITTSPTSAFPFLQKRKLVERKGLAQVLLRVRGWD